MNEYDRHIEHSQLTELTLNKRASKKQIDLEDLVIKRMEYKKLHNAILKLPEIQKKRLMLYFFKGLTLKKIATIEKTSIRAVQYTISIALKNLKKFLQ